MCFCGVISNAVGETFKRGGIESNMINMKRIHVVNMTFKTENKVYNYLEDVNKWKIKSVRG